jgi:hypothetical protein
VEAWAEHIKYDRSGLDRARGLFDAIKGEGITSAGSWLSESGDFTPDDNRALKDVDTNRPGRNYAEELSRKVRDGIILYGVGKQARRENKVPLHGKAWYHFSVFRDGRTAGSFDVT